jgi:group II intron reverse transcriptase/maturase
MSHTGGGGIVGNEYERIAQLAREHQKLQTLMHYVNQASLEEEHDRQESGKATGIDGVTKASYEENIEANIEGLLRRMRQFSYQPQPVRRTYIPKAGSDKMRPLGIPAYEDKLVQGVMRKVLDAIYDGKFYDFSYGFRAGRNCHQAIKEVNRIIRTKKINWIVDADIKGFFDNVDHEWMMKFLEHDIADKNFLRYVKRFLKAGIMEDMERYESDKGTPQGGLISPVLANVYLHYVLDIWFDRAAKRQARGEASIVRYADDFVCMFQYKDDAESFYKALRERLAKFGLGVAEEKSRVIQFGRYAKERSAGSRLDTFDFLGFTFINGKARTGKYRVVHRTSQKKMEAKKQAVKEWLRINMHENAVKLTERLNKKLVGHYRYYGISGNIESLKNFYWYVTKGLYRVLTRRSQRKKLTWKRFRELLKEGLVAKPRIYVDIWTA